MNIQLLDKDAPFITALMAGVEFRRNLIEQGLSVRNAADELSSSAEQLATLVNLCFWSSLAVEEGRAVKGTICVCSPDEAPPARAFLAPEPVSVKSLVALLTASPRSPLAVHSGENGPMIWGVLDAVPMFRLRLRIAAVGTVVASSDRKVLALLQGGTVHIPPKGAGEFDWVMLVANAFDRAKSFPERMMLAARFLRVVATMHRHGHGGALVVVPTSTDTWNRHIKFSFCFDDLSAWALRDRLQEWEKVEKLRQEFKTNQMGETQDSMLSVYPQAVEAHRELVDSTLRSIGDLSAIDGALIMDENLTVFGFGAKLHAESIEFQMTKIDALSGTKENVPYTELGGTRHQSAARFIHENHEALVFVASQDGRLTLITWVADPGEVVAIQNLEHFVWEYCA